MEPTKRTIEAYTHLLFRYGLRTRQEVIIRCQQKGYSLQEIRAAVQQLETNGLIDDRRYARMYLEEGLRLKEKGPKVLRWELLQKGVDTHVIEDEWEKVRVEVDMTEIIRSYIRKRRVWTHEKIKSSLMRRGFDREWIGLVDEIYEEENRDEEEWNDS